MSASWQLQRKCLFFFLGLSKQTEKLSNLCEIFYCVSIIDLFVKCDTINSVSCLFPPKILVLVTQWWTTLCNLTDCSLPGSSVHEIFQARTLEVAICFSRESSWPRDWAWISHIAGKFFNIWAIREARFHPKVSGFFLTNLLYFLRAIMSERNWCNVFSAKIVSYGNI